MGDKPSHGSQGTDSSANGAPAPATGDLAEIKALLSELSSELVALKASVPVTVNAALTARLKRDGTKDGDDGAGGDTPEPPTGKKPAATDPALAAMQREVAAMRSQLAAKEAEAQAAHRERALRAAIANSGVAVVDPEAAYRVLAADFEPDETGALRPRDPAQAGKTLDVVVKARIGAMPYLHAPSGKSGGNGVGTAKPAQDAGYTFDPKLSREDNIRAWRAKNAATG